MRISDWSSDVCSSDLFDATETSYATYAMGDYDIPLGPDISLDGTVGVRVIKTDRTISSYRGEDNGDLTKVTANTSDVDLLPSATARVKFHGGFQARFGYSRTMRRPDFGSPNQIRKLN